MLLAVRQEAFFSPVLNNFKHLEDTDKSEVAVLIRIHFPFLQYTKSRRIADPAAEKQTSLL